MKIGPQGKTKFKKHKMQLRLKRHNGVGFSMELHHTYQRPKDSITLNKNALQAETKQKKPTLGHIDQNKHPRKNQVWETENAIEFGMT